MRLVELSNLHCEKLLHVNRDSCDIWYGIYFRVWVFIVYLQDVVIDS